MDSRSTQAVKGDRLAAELERLYGFQHQTEVGELERSDSRVLILELRKPSEWQSLAVIWNAFSLEWGMPAPGIAVNGSNGVQLWFSLSQPASLETCECFLAALCKQFLTGLPAGRVAWFPRSQSLSGPMNGLSMEVPVNVSGTDQWSAFVTRDLAAVFGDEPWVDVPPVRDQQAEMLSRLSSMSTAQMEAVLGILGARSPSAQANLDSGTVAPLSPRSVNKASTSRSSWQGPAEFLWGTMNNSALPMGERIEAAKALLPYPESHWKRG